MQSIHPLEDRIDILYHVKLENQTMYPKRELGFK
jgi:hypothetical protein